MDEKLKQKLIEAVKAGDENQASELLWQLVIDCQNKTQTKGVNSMRVYAVIPEDYKVGVSGKYYVMADVS